MNSDKTPASADLVLDGEKIRLRSTKAEDLDYVLKAENDPVNSPHIVNWSIEQHRTSLNDADTAHLIIERIDSGKQVGYQILRGLKTDRGPIELKRIVITEKRQGHGLQSLSLSKELVFEKMQRRRLWLNVLPHNHVAKALYQSAGFRYEGTWRDSFLTEEGYEDLELMTVLSTDGNEAHSFHVGSRKFTFIRSFAKKHFRQLFDLYQHEWPSNSRTLEDIMQVVQGSEFVVGVVEESSNDLIGFCRIISDRGFRSWMFGLMVREDLRCLGIGKAIMDRLSHSPELVGIHSLSLTCAPHMIPFYKKWGFTAREHEVVMDLQIRK